MSKRRNDCKNGEPFAEARKHRGSALSEESGNEESVESEFRKFRESQLQREFSGDQRR